MFKRFLTGAALALAAAVVMGAPAHATVVTFENKPAFTCSPGVQSDMGLNFAQGFMACYYSPASPGDFPTPLTSTVMGLGYNDTFVTTVSGVSFDLNSLDLAFGPVDIPNLLSDTTTVTGYLDGGGTVSTQLTVGYGFHTYNLDWQGLTGVNVAHLSQTSSDGVPREYLAFDNVNYTALGPNPVPEPGVWLVMLLGFAGSGLMLRRAHQLSRTYTA